eukprot:scpid36228/ scgid5919/ Coiled-coil domain-containing protein 111
MSSSFYGKSRTKRQTDGDEVDDRIAKRLATAERVCKVPVSRDTDRSNVRAHSTPSSAARGRLLVTRKSWKFFSRQQPAMDFACKSHGNLHVFSFEDPLLGGQGRRRFLVSSYYQFYSWYKSIKKLERTFYEVIPEGCVCRLYFDLEYAKEHNGGHDPDLCTALFVKVVCFYLQQEYSIECSPERVLDLDSSTEKKFSRHLIFHLDSCCFQNNIEAGRFVQYVCGDLWKHIKSSQSLSTDLSAESLQQLVIKKADGSEDLFCDQGVYTRNRNFRLLGSSKLGKSAYLNVATMNRFMYLDAQRALDPLNTDLQGTADANQYALFLSSLVCAVRYSPTADVKVLTFRSGVQSKLSFSKASPNASSKADTGTRAQASAGSSASHASTVTSAVYSSSPFPDVDRFVLSMLPKRSGDGVAGVVRKWFYFAEGKTLSYDIGGNRWCQNVRRHHKSNHIMIVVDLALGTYYQKCHDPDCRRSGYRSPEQLLPDALQKPPSSQQEEKAEDGELTGDELDAVLIALELTDVYLDHFSAEDDTGLPGNCDDIASSDDVIACSDDITKLVDDSMYDAIFGDDGAAEITADDKSAEQLHSSYAPGDVKAADGPAESCAEIADLTDDDLLAFVDDEE